VKGKLASGRGRPTLPQRLPADDEHGPAVRRVAALAGVPGWISYEGQAAIAALVEGGR
jgi:hypothetical protein